MLIKKFSRDIDILSMNWEDISEGIYSIFENL